MLLPQNYNKTTKMTEYNSTNPIENNKLDNLDSVEKHLTGQDISDKLDNDNSVNELSDKLFYNQSGSVKSLEENLGTNETYTGNSSNAESIPEPEDLISELFIKDKLKFQRYLINHTLEQIYSRRKNLNNNLENIDKSLCRFHTLEFQIAEPVYTFNNQKNKEKTSIEKMISNLYLTKSLEYNRYWADVLKLKQNILPLVSEYLNLKKKAKILGMGYDRYNYNKTTYSQSTILPIYNFPVRMP